MEKQRAFTLIELIVTVSVVGILLAVGIPGFRELMLNNQRASAVNDFITTMHIARSEAVTRNSRVMVCTSNDAATCGAGGDWDAGWIAFADTDNDGVLDGDEEVLETREEVGGFEISSDTFSSFITFRPNGRAMTADVNTATGEFIFCDPRGGDYSRVVIIGASGRPRSSETTSAGNTPACT